MQSEESNNLFSFDYLNNLKQNILSLSEQEYKEIYKIITKNNISHTKNSRGFYQLEIIK